MKRWWIPKSWSWLEWMIMTHSNTVFSFQVQSHFQDFRSTHTVHASLKHFEAFADLWRQEERSRWSSFWHKTKTGVCSGGNDWATCLILSSRGEKNMEKTREEEHTRIHTCLVYGCIWWDGHETDYYFSTVSPLLLRWDDWWCTCALDSSVSLWSYCLASSQLEHGVTKKRFRLWSRKFAQSQKQLWPSHVFNCCSFQYISQVLRQCEHPQPFTRHFP